MKLPIHLAYERSICPSEVAFLVVWPDGNREPLPCYSKTILGFNEGSHVGYDGSGAIRNNLKMNTLVQGNIHELDYCSVPYGAKSVECSFSVSFSSELLKPYKCSDAGVKKTLREFVSLYNQRVGLEELIIKYLTNIALGTWLWRNTKRSYCVSIEIRPWPWEGETIIIDDIRKYLKGDRSTNDLLNWNKLIEQVKEAFTDPMGLCILEVKANLIKPTMAQLYPSQMFKEAAKKENNRLYQSTIIDGIKSPIMGCYKTGAAIATIDTWYPDAEEPIRVGHYGVDRENSTAYRHPNTGKDFFSILKRTDEFVDRLKDIKELNQDELNDMHFLMANLIKGGLFQEKGE
ncbi:type I-F CRISPR-associated protein Csy3 [Vibrio parahaemolyticus]|uniref:type I-F CRISPR-associated protein Csy3 n=1 Tax=Vibrio parahaemolyticus TaxID=670 RepID=UPI00044D8C22|nr:type I-F CRISPR-associated protein Csy3 [Vibrio parahaemolyticus]EJG0871116.1 type I-F CRISPR-associated protein Csy3 [Vibrio parahaemolyticus O3]EJG0899775.1 type I-F CRISPR-associated protein Csy3 [Vibrio parahaemolyticus O3:K56]EJG1072597.1 type I-F CRISPR-associated protein Csy3 [Vibrio parahaemolyticus O1:K56]EGQ8276325.1 type I-F CRISPR-associated protein Csy3 [Vibrio parahaemolyticus]EGR1974312.1 type I-F CRISPR-associated protein Csy3 [Vibrio parahaemolyticus]